ncbi:AB-hydrolase-associated lipase region [Metarhizium album ARSEF 1941]|uniref:AB-hydrolase-associated lipase region n=1 Tax=Metarhizium album (strain ARSEF 1941) TaxID=1081103 RepID=A0A0B2X2U8_METAS|nr:AB-hydrolase-associated lipase region [Metarhizium album ARSEF 1941]KHO00639.1 AB-hydrolase-associated lipase region [Metarhizium album ARSEF 1941]
MAKPPATNTPSRKDVYGASSHELTQLGVQIKREAGKTSRPGLGELTDSAINATKASITHPSPSSLQSNEALRTSPLRAAPGVADEANGFMVDGGNHEKFREVENHAQATSSLFGKQNGFHEPQVPANLPCNAGEETLQNGWEENHSSRINPLFPPLPVYGPPTFQNRLQHLFFRLSAAILSLAFLSLIVVASVITSIPSLVKQIIYKSTLRDIKETRLFYEEELRRAHIRTQKQKAWDHRVSAENIGGDQEGTADEYPPTEGGRDKIVCDVGYYARRVGLDVDAFKVRTEDGFLIDLWHVYDPREYITNNVDAEMSGTKNPRKVLKSSDITPKLPVLLVHGLLQSSGAYCGNDDESLAFWLCKSGFDVWLGNNRCGLSPVHESFTPTDPRMWSWNIRQMGIFDLPALTAKVLAETGFGKLGLICHSQGTAETLIALSKDQCPEFGEKLTVFCGLAPAAFPGPLIDKFYFKFMRNISPFWFRTIFGIHSFIPFMMQMHSLVSPTIYGWLGYKVFSFLFNWSDARWDRGLRNRFFQFAPVHVSAETMRWWLGKDGFAKHKCILSTKEGLQSEERPENGILPGGPLCRSSQWFNEQVPPFALWVCGNDQLVDGERLLRRFANGQEPFVKMVHSKVIQNYEHLDVIWAIDAVDQVFVEIREVLWKTCHARDRCRVPEGCEGIPAWTPESIQQQL